MFTSLQVVGNCQTNRGTEGISALGQIEKVKREEREKIQNYLKSMPAIRQKTQTSGQRNTL